MPGKLVLKHSDVENAVKTLMNDVVDFVYEEIADTLYKFLANPHIVLEKRKFMEKVVEALRSQTSRRQPRNSV